VKLNPELIIQIIKEMKTLKLENFNEFVLSNEEMINVRGGNGAAIILQDGPTRPPIIIEF
jgi:natural product precursor